MTLPHLQQRESEDSAVLEDQDDPDNLKQEAKFLGFYGEKIANVLRETELLAVGTDNGRDAIAIKFPTGYQTQESPMESMKTKAAQGIGKVLRDLKWRNSNSEQN